MVKQKSATVRGETGTYHATYRACETGTYRWMAPEVITHARYGAKCDVYSFAIVLWEITAAGAMPYPGVPALHVALGVAQSPGLRPNIPVTARARRAGAPDAALLRGGAGRAAAV